MCEMSFDVLQGAKNAALIENTSLRFAKQVGNLVLKTAHRLL